MDNDISRRVVAEFFGTFWLVLGGCGAAVLAAGGAAAGAAFVSFAAGAATGVDGPLTVTASACFGWRAVGQRTDTINGRRAITVTGLISPFMAPSRSSAPCQARSYWSICG